MSVLLKMRVHPNPLPLGLPPLSTDGACVVSSRCHTYIPIYRRWIPSTTYIGDGFPVPLITAVFLEDPWFGLQSFSQHVAGSTSGSVTILIGGS